MSDNNTKTYALNTVAGVKKLLRDRHLIGELRFNGDSVASDILVDLDNAIWRAHLTDRQAQAIALVYGVGVTQADAAETLGISQQAVQISIDAACKRIARIYRKWDYGEVAVAVPEGGAAA